MTNEELRIANGGTRRPFIKRGFHSFIPHSSLLIPRSSRAFTLIELLVVVGMIALIMGALSTSMSSAMQRARIQKATGEVSALSQAFVAYENYSSDHSLPTIQEWKEADRNTIGFLVGLDGEKTQSGDAIPVLVQAALTSDGVMRDPWGKPYYVKITSGNIRTRNSSFKTGYYLPNFYRLTKEERK